MSGPNSKPEAGQQDYRTPPDFLRAVERKFGVQIGFDLACTRENAVAPFGIYHPGQDALASPWPEMAPGHAAFCNPPFGRSGAFARVASECVGHCRSILLIPASVGSKWFAEHVAGIACVVFLRPRIEFLLPDGTPCGAGINRDCMLAAYGWAPGMHCEDWRGW